MRTHALNLVAQRKPTLSLDKAAKSAVEPRLPRLYSADLFRNGQNELLIEHRGACYRLRLTRQDKLILNK